MLRKGTWTILKLKVNFVCFSYFEHIYAICISATKLWKNVPKSKWNRDTKFRCSGSCNLRDIKDFPLSIINDNVCRSCPLFTTFCPLFTTVSFIYHLVYYLPLFVHYLPPCPLFITLSTIYHFLSIIYHFVQYLQIVVHYLPLLTPGDLTPYPNPNPNPN